MAATVAGLQADQLKRKKTKTFNVILCPSHIKEKWVREIEETLPNTFAGIVNTITDLNRLYSFYEKGDRNCYAIISKEMARDGYMSMPAVIWSKRKRAFVCPDCGEIIQMTISNDGSKYIVDADQFYFKKQNKENRKCEHCETPLWTAVNPNIKRKSEWVKVSNYGFVFCSQAKKHLYKVKNAAFEEKIYRIIQQPESIATAVGAHRKYSISTFIKKHYKGRIDGLVVDELHRAPVRVRIKSALASSRQTLCLLPTDLLTGETLVGNIAFRKRV